MQGGAKNSDADSGAFGARCERALLVVALASGAVFAGLYVFLPPSIDQWQLDYTGWCVTRGEAPYTDIRDGNWPAAHWLHALSVAIQGPTFGGWRRFDLFLLLPTLWSGATVATRIGGRLAGAWWLLLYPALYTTLGYWVAGQRDIIAGHFCLVSIAAAWPAIEGRRWPWALVSGFALSLAALVKPTFALAAVLVAGVALASIRTGRLRARAAVEGLAIVAAFSVSALIAAAGVLWLQGSTIEAFWLHAIEAILARTPTEAMPAAPEQPPFARAFTSWHWIGTGALLATVAVLRDRDRSARSAVALVWALIGVGLVSHAAQGGRFFYYLGPVFTGLALLLCGGLGRIFALAARPGPTRLLAGLAIGVVALGTTFKAWTAYGELWPVLVGQVERAEWERRFDAGDGLSAADARVLAAEIAPWVPPGEALLVWGRANVLNLLVARPQPTGFYHPPHVERDDLPRPILDAWEREIWTDLERTPPAVAVVADPVGQPRSALQHALEARLARDYDVVRRMGRATVRRRRDPASAASDPRADRAAR